MIVIVPGTMLRWLCLVVVLNLACGHEETSITRKIYVPLESNHFCFRRFNATHQFGCSSPESGSSGLVKEIRNDFYQDDLEYITARGTDAPYVVLLGTDLFRLSTLAQLSRAGPRRVAGVVVLDDKSARRHLKGHSADRPCPNELFSLYTNDEQFGFCKTQKWNLGSKIDSEDESGMLFFDYPFPMFVLRNQSDIDRLKMKVKQTENEVWPKLGLELFSAMSGAESAQTCIRRSVNAGMLDREQYCDALGGRNLYYNTIGSTQQVDNNSVLLLSARLDSFSMFDNLSPGADSVASSLIVLLATLEALHRPEARTHLSAGLQAHKPLVVALFDGEAFDYIGSSWAAHQMSTGKFALVRKFANGSLTYQKYLGLQHLGYLLELDQVAHYGKLGDDVQQLWLHRHLNGTKATNSLADLIIKESQAAGKAIVVNEVPAGAALPPASVQSFLKLRNDEDLGTVVVTNHEHEYVNTFYNSMFEDHNIFGGHLDTQARFFTHTASLMVRVVWRFMAPDAGTIPQANATFVLETMKCLFNTSTCPLFQMILSPDVFNASEPHQQEPPLPTYVGVYDPRNLKLLRSYLHLLLAYVTSESVTDVSTKQQCKDKEDQESDKSWDYHWMNGWAMKGVCRRSRAYYEDSHSPAFDGESFEIQKDQLARYGLWAESKWNRIELRMFLMSSRLQQWLTLVLGCLIFTFSLILVYYFSSNSALYFDLDNDSLNDSIEVIVASFEDDGDDGDNGDVRAPFQANQSNANGKKRSSSHESDVTEPSST